LVNNAGGRRCGERGTSTGSSTTEKIKIPANPAKVDKACNAGETSIYKHKWCSIVQFTEQWSTICEITTFYFEVAVCTGILKAGILFFSVASFLSTAYPIRP